MTILFSLGMPSRLLQFFVAEIGLPGRHIAPDRFKAGHQRQILAGLAQAIL